MRLPYSLNELGINITGVPQIIGKPYLITEIVNEQVIYK